MAMPRDRPSACGTTRRRVEGQGDYPVWPSTAYSIELQARVAVPEWDGQTVQVMLEEDAWFDGSGCTFVDGRQTELWLI